MNYTYIASGTLNFNTGANYQFFNGSNIEITYITSGSVIASGVALTLKYSVNYIYANTGGQRVLSGAAIIQIATQDYIYNPTGKAIFSGAVSVDQLSYVYTAIPTSTMLRGAAIYSFKSFQAFFNYYPFGKIILWNTGVNIDQIRYFGTVYKRYGSIVSPLLDNNQPYTTN